ncbi:MAG: HAD family hydrolase [Nitrospirae bacterium]|nr:MAG: HAD family hydrolase [Nitrospirota bacterium]
MRMTLLKDKIKLLIFDLDGTLVDSLQDITDAINYAIAPLGYKPLTPERARNFVGKGVTKLIEQILNEKHIDRLQDVLDRFLEYYSQNLTTHTRAYPGVKETLEALKDYKKAVLSNKRQKLSERILKELGLIGHFSYVIGSDTLNQKKPSPQGILYLLEKEGLGPEEAMIIGDSELDIEAGKRAGVLTVSVGYGYRDPELLKGADYFINGSLTTLIELLEGPSPGSS